MKDELSPAFAGGIAEDITNVWSSFDSTLFESHVSQLESCELMARVALIGDALVATMPQDPVVAERVIRDVANSGGFEGWASAAVNAYIAKALLDHPAMAMSLFEVLTSRFSAEFAIRPFIIEHPGFVMGRLAEWVSHPDEHVRRLVSEGSRPRLPWAPVLRSFIANPSPTLELLERLFDDDSEYVRRSVANHLNDISKDHPDLAIETAARWSVASTHGDYVSRHALRSLVKRGNPEALRVLGFDHAADIELVDIFCEPARIAIGETVTFRFGLQPRLSTRVVIDYLITYQGANGPKAPKAFKLRIRELHAGITASIERRHSFAHVSIRRIHAGPHRIDIQVNGHVLGGVDFHVID